MAGIYIHIPFCLKRCVYCDFFSTTSLKEKMAYTDALCREIELRKDYLSEKDIQTVYFGGGTPSLLKADDFGKIFESIAAIPDKHNKISVNLQEVTLEANPDDITPDYLANLRQLPFNRISLGIQSFLDEDLQFLNRRHDATRALQAIDQCRDAGFDNISIDLIYGLPGQTQENWIRNIDLAIRSRVCHISAYHLIYEEGTRLYRMLQEKKIRAIDEELSVNMFSDMIDRLTTASFIHYEISNFGKSGFFSRHNSSYWNGTHYMGIGASAHSYNGTGRQWNVSSLKSYIDHISGGIVPAEAEIIDPATAYNDYILTGLRTMWGINLQQIENLFGEKQREYCLKQARKHICGNMLSLEGDILRLQRPGIFVSDGIISDLLIVP